MSYYKPKEFVILDADVYRKGIEDGFGIVNGSDCGCCQDSCGYCKNYKPFINTSEGKSFISDGDYIVYDRRGKRNVIRKGLFEQVFMGFSNE